MTKPSVLPSSSSWKNLLIPLWTRAANNPMAIRWFSGSKLPIFASVFIRCLMRRAISDISLPVKSTISGIQPDLSRPLWGFRLYHDGRPRGPLWRSRKAIGKEALFVIQGLKRFKEDEEKLEKFMKSHVLRLLKLDMIAVLGELERQEEVALAVKVCSPFLFFYMFCPFCSSFWILTYILDFTSWVVSNS